MVDIFESENADGLELAKKIHSAIGGRLTGTTSSKNGTRYELGNTDSANPVQVKLMVDNYYKSRKWKKLANGGMYTSPEYTDQETVAFDCYANPKNCFINS